MMRTKRYIRRTGETNDKFTTDKIYRLYGNKVINDMGEISEPYLRGTNYWINYGIFL